MTPLSPAPSCGILPDIPPNPMQRMMITDNGIMIRPLPLKRRRTETMNQFRHRRFIRSDHNRDNRVIGPPIPRKRRVIDNDDPMHMIRHHDKRVHPHAGKMFRDLHPAPVRDEAVGVQHHAAVAQAAEPFGAVFDVRGDEIRPARRIIESGRPVRSAFAHDQYSTGNGRRTALCISPIRAAAYGAHDAAGVQTHITGGRVVL